MRLILWAVRAGGHVLTVETRDRIDWLDDSSDATVRVGAIAEVPWRDPLAMGDALRTHEATAAMHDASEAREVTHRRAVEMLALANGWTREVDGEIVAAVEMERIGEGP